MTDIVERLRGSPHTRCLDPMCFEGYQVCPHDEEEILEAEERLMEEAAKEIERLRDENARLRAALEKIEKTVAWGYPDNWETTPAEVRQLARKALEAKG